MRILIQRVKNASVTIDGEEKSRISGGLLALVGFCDGDKEEYIRSVAKQYSGKLPRNVYRALMKYEVRP